MFSSWVFLPHDILRLIVVFAAYDDPRTAVQLALVSRASQYWVDWVLYSTVNLYRPSKSRAFLRTIETSATKSLLFFATRVKSLSISFDPFADDHTSKILSACSGVQSLTLYVVPHSYYDQKIHLHHSYNCFALIRHHSLIGALSHLRPRRLSCRFNRLLYTPNPPFYLPFFSQVTHFTVTNGWEDWTSWFGFERLPRLTHLALRLRICAGVQAFGRNGGAMNEYQLPTVANMLADVLNRCEELKVCAVLLSYDVDPTASVEWLVEMVNRSRKRAIVGDCDHRLVFVDVGKTVWGCEAESACEEELWRRAEEMIAGRCVP